MALKLKNHKMTHYLVLGPYFQAKTGNFKGYSKASVAVYWPCYIVECTELMTPLRTTTQLYGYASEMAHSFLEVSSICRIM